MSFRRFRGQLLRCAATLSIPSLFVCTAEAASYSLPEDLPQELLSESVPTAFEVARFRESDFQIHWLAAPPADFRLELVPGSLTWVRVARTLVLPRARIRISAPHLDSVQLRVGKLVQPVVADGGEAPVSLVSQVHELSVLQRGKVSKYPFTLVFAPNAQSMAAGLKSRVFVDLSCSPHRVEVSANALASDQWAYLGCRMVYSKSGEKPVPQLEIHLAWSGARAPVSIAGIPQAQSSDRFFTTTTLLSADHPRARFRDSNGAEFEVSAGIPRRLKTAFVGVGLGPYSYSIQVPGRPAVQSVAPIATFYGSYFLTESSRAVFFDAFPVHGEWYNDFGLYFNSESTRAIDEKLSINLLLGFHLISFKSNPGVQHRLGAPQGFEMIYRDAFGRRNNLSVGGFFYPPIAGKAYYNMWFRVGSSKVFGELNYLSWREVFQEGEQALSRSLGVCVGAPLLFW